MSIRIGLVGYGQGGRYFHAPYIEAAQGCELAGVVARHPDRAALVRAELPHVRLFSSLSELIDGGMDAVVVSTPPPTHRELTLAAIARGINVVVDKPFAPTAAIAEELVAAAESAGVVLSVFQNRRWDTDIVTLRGVLTSGELGRPWRFDSRFDLDEPLTLEVGPSGGLLRDVGSHLADQALFLFGPAEYVHAELDWLELPDGVTDAGFVVTIRHTNGVHSHISSTKVNHLRSRELRLLGERGSYESSFADVQAQAVFSGARPASDRAAWGYEKPERWGRLHTSSGTMNVPSAQGDYTAFYELFAAAIEHQAEPPVPGRDAVATARVLDAARLSATEQRTIRLAGGEPAS
jgi:predicted dehydrogenase